MRRYPKYKDSGELWFGEIPDHWVRKRVKHTSKITYGDSLKEEDRKDGGFPVYGSNGVVGYHDISFTVGETIIIGRKGSYGKINWSGQSCFPIDTTFYIDKKNTTNHLRWLFYVLGQLQLDSFTKDSSVPGINREEIYERYLICPPLPEQYQIVDFLDQKTSLIETLIEKKLQKIELLKEHRTTIINHTVTKGLNPYVKLKDSGVEWTGEIPEHWEPRRINTLGRFSKGDGIKKDEILSSGLPCIRYGEIYTQYDRVVYSTVSFINEESSSQSVPIQKGVVLFTGSGETMEDIGKTVVYYGDDEVFVGGDIIILKLQEGLNPLFISYLMNCHYVIYQKSIVGKGEIVVHIYSKDLRDIKTFIPPLPEQQQIVEYLDQKTNEIDTTITLENKKIDLLKEYRQILISEVVTGKIDVRKN